MDDKTRYMVLGIVILAIIGAVIYLEKSKVAPSNIVEEDSATQEKLTDTILNKPVEVENVVDTMVEKNEPVVVDTTERDKRIAAKAEKYDVAKELVRPFGYINTEPFTITENIGKKVILVDFWTYSCINCQRTLPYLNDWEEKYADDGLLIIGVHAPEFDFEKELPNVQNAVDKYGIKYPVVLDNAHTTWRAYENRYWPRKYLIDIDGFIVYDHIGEGAYAETENKIQELLKERKEVLKTDDVITSDLSKPNVTAVDSSSVKTPEIYFGYKYSRNQIGNNEGWVKDQIVDYTMPSVKSLNYFYLDGSWKNNPDEMELVSDTGLVDLKYTAKSVNIVAGSAVPTEITVFVDGKQVNTLIVDKQQLYNIVSMPDYGTHTVEIKAQKGFMIYTFTFG